MPGRDVRVATRELVYTAITRASSAVTIASRRDVFEQACARVTGRRSGLPARIAEACT
jgi:exodeoxyribonuclease V alpha subunit